MLDYAVIYNITESLATKNNETNNNLIPVILPLMAVLITILIFYITYSKMKKPEQINLLHQIQVMYFDFFDKYTNAIEIRNHNLENIYYLNLLSILEWYLFLLNKKQINVEFDYHFQTFFKAVKSVYHKYKGSILEGDYPLVKKRFDLIDREKIK